MGRGGDRLRPADRVAVGSAEIVERDLDFFFSYFVALEGCQWGVVWSRWRSIVPCPGTFGVPFAMLARDG